MYACNNMFCINMYWYLKKFNILTNVKILFYFLIDSTNSETKDKLMDQTIAALETYYCIDFHLLSDRLS